MTSLELFILLFGVFLGVCGASYTFFEDSYFFILAEHASIGMGMAYGLYQTLISLKTSSVDLITKGSWWLIIPLLIGALSFTRLTRYRWAARYYNAVLAGVGVGVAFGATIRAEILAGIQMTISDIVKSPNAISAWLVLVGFICTVTYFMYSAKLSNPFHSPRGRLRFIMKLGRIFMMASFGYLYSRIFIDECIDLIGNGVVILLRRTILSLLKG
jgi:hypothetical protein